MTHRFFTSLNAKGFGTVILSLMAVSVAAQGPTATEQSATTSTWTARTVWDEPDLQGVWNFATTTPLERPDAFGDRTFLSDAEVEQLDQELRTRQDSAPPPGSTGTYNQFWWDRGKSIGRTSLIVDPTEGKLPPLSPRGQERAAAREELRRARAAVGSYQEGTFDSHEDRPLDERCVVRLTEGPPMRPGGYNNNFQVFQTPGYVFILNEQVHSVRTIPTDGRQHLDPDIPMWAGSSSGRWEGDTLVVETRNFHKKKTFVGSTEQMRLVERFTRLSADQMEYKFTVDDPTTWSAPWTAIIPVRSTGEPIYEYACHEGNYSIAGALSGARAKERDASGGADNQ
jgi:hypothetical protein